MRTIITLMTDFGLSDPYVGQLKGRILAIAPDVRLVDLTHAVPGGEVLAGAFLLSRASESFKPGTVHLAVVDPEVGTLRAALAVHASGHWFVGPDNGLLSLAARAPDSIWQLNAERTVPGRVVSRTFHGRDLFAPAAARIASGVHPREFATEVQSMVRLPVPVEEQGASVVGEVLWVDHFGNAITAIDPFQVEELGPEIEIRAGGLRLPVIHETFADVSSLTPLAYFGSSGTLELAVRDGDLSERFGVRRGMRVEVRPARKR